MQFDVAAASICFAPKFAGSPDLALVALDEWEQRWEARGISTQHATKACRMRVLLLNGRFREALAIGTHAGREAGRNAAWVSAPARSFEALILAQKGQFRSALSLAESTRRITMLHGISPTISGDLEGFAMFVAHWARGTTTAALRTLEQVAATNRADLSAVQGRTGLIDLGIILFSLHEARWDDAAELADQLLTSLADADPMGITPLVHTTCALARAALGENDRAWNALFHGETPADPGVSVAFHGFLGNLALRARQWLRDPDLIARANELAEWARAEELPLVELKALDIVVHESATPDTALLERAEALAPLVEQPVGPAILAHIKAMMQLDGDPEPNERLLSELGIWMPLPPVSQLTGREREIALFTSLGYSSKHVAERLQLSARTVETHLTHVYAKLNVDGREELRDWFSRSRERQ